MTGRGIHHGRALRAATLIPGGSGLWQTAHVLARDGTSASSNRRGKETANWHRGRVLMWPSPRSHRTTADGNAHRAAVGLNGAGAENAVTRVPQGSPGTRKGLREPDGVPREAHPKPSGPGGTGPGLPTRHPRTRRTSGPIAGEGRRVGRIATRVSLPSFPRARQRGQRDSSCTLHPCGWIPAQRCACVYAPSARCGNDDGAGRRAADADCAVIPASAAARPTGLQLHAPSLRLDSRSALRLRVRAFGTMRE